MWGNYNVALSIACAACIADLSTEVFYQIESLIFVIWSQSTKCLAYQIYPARGSDIWRNCVPRSELLN